MTVSMGGHFQETPGNTTQVSESSSVEKQGEVKKEEALSLTEKGQTSNGHTVRKPNIHYTIQAFKVLQSQMSKEDYSAKMGSEAGKKELMDQAMKLGKEMKAKAEESPAPPPQPNANDLGAITEKHSPSSLESTNPPTIDSTKASTTSRTSGKRQTRHKRRTERSNQETKTNETALPKLNVDTSKGKEKEAVRSETSQEKPTIAPTDTGIISKTDQTKNIFHCANEIKSSEQAYNKDIKALSAALKSDPALAKEFKAEIRLLDKLAAHSDKILAKLDAHIHEDSVDVNGLKELFQSGDMKQAYTDFADYNTRSTRFGAELDRIAEQGNSTIANHKLSVENMGAQGMGFVTGKPMQRSGKYALLLRDLQGHVGKHNAVAGQKIGEAGNSVTEMTLTMNSQINAGALPLSFNSLKRGMGKLKMKETLSLDNAGCVTTDPAKAKEKASASKLLGALEQGVSDGTVSRKEIRIMCKKMGKNKDFKAELKQDKELSARFDTVKQETSKKAEKALNQRISDMDLEKLSKHVLEDSKDKDTENPLRSLSVSLSSYISQSTNALSVIRDRTQELQGQLKEAKTPQEKNEIENELQKQEKSLEQTQATIGRSLADIKSSLKEAKDLKFNLEAAGKHEAANKIDAHLALFNESGDLVADFATAKQTIMQNSGDKQFVSLINGESDNLRARLFAEDNLLREPLEERTMELFQNVFKSIDNRLTFEENKEALNKISESMQKANKAIADFHALPDGMPLMKDMIGKKDDKHHPYLKDQNLSLRSDDELKILKEKATKLKEDLLEIQQELHSVPYKKDKESVFVTLFAVHNHVAGPLSRLTGEGAQLLGHPQKPAQFGQIDELLGLIAKEEESRDIAKAA